MKARVPLPFLLALALALGAATPSGCAAAPDTVPFAAPERLPEPGTPEAALWFDGAVEAPGILVERQTYRVTESDPDRLSEALNRAARAAGLDHLARVRWDVSWDYKLEAQGRTCKVARLSTALAVRYHMPQWEPDGPTSDAQAREWERFVDALAVHEYGHALIGLRVRQAIQRELRPMQMRRGGCDALRRKLNGRANALILAADDAGYDKSTGHGQTQGARLRTGL